MHQLGNLLGAIGVAPLHLANAFARFANDSKYCAPVAIAEVTDASGGKLPAETSNWVAGYTSGIATASFFGGALEGQKRPGQNVTINGKFYKAIDGYMLAGPQWANYMVQVAGLYPAAAFPPPPESMTKPPTPGPPD